MNGKNKEKQEKARQNNQHTWHIYIKLYDTGCELPILVDNL